MKENQILLYFGTDPFKAARELMEASETWKNWKTDESIGIKPNLVVAKKASSGATTHPEFVAGVIDFLQEKGFSRISIVEGSWVGDSTPRAFKVCGYDAVSREYGVPLVDLQKDAAVSCEVDGENYRICRSVAELDRLINLPVLKGHCQTRMTCALKNLKGCIPDCEKRRYHREGLHRPIADLNAVLKADLILVDGKNGDPDFEEGGNPQELNMFMASVDPVLTDSYGASILGLDTAQVPYIGKAAALGAGELYSEESEIVYLNKGEGVKGIRRTAKAENLTHLIDENGACSACYASLVDALTELEKRNALPGEPVKIGQGFKGTSVSGKGIGQCLSGTGNFVGGCPPSPKDIVRFLS